MAGETIGRMSGKTIGRMEFDTFGPADAEETCLFALGWGNRPEHRPVRWLLDRLVDAGYSVHAATLPVHVTDVQREWVEPLEEYAVELAAGGSEDEDLQEYALLAHSAGGLTAALADLPGATTRTYLSPWWGEPPGRQSAVVSLAARIPGDWKILPSGLDSTDLLGEHATERQVEEGPDRVSPAFLRATRRAHAALPPIEDDAVVFCSLSDRVVSTRAIGDRVPAERIRLYDGGHELFSSRSRETQFPRLIDALCEVSR